RELAADLIAGLDLMEQAQVRVVIIRAAPGAKVWSAGFDINELPHRRRDPLGYEDALERLLRRVQDFPSPIIAMVEGSVWGGACDLCLSCDFIMCTPEATFAITPAKIGLPYNASGLVHFLNELGPHKAKEMFFTALPLTAQEAENCRMVNHVLPADELEAYTLRIAQAIARNSPLAVRVLKRQFRLLLSGQVLSPETFESIQGMRREVYDSTDYEEGIQAFKEKRPPVFKGA
ncbi:MAG TPA: methylmalonyl-CoA decarboxylase, partial [Anaerolineae bacterium]|nr:methylmalonyl-CoA decarboxylase [Anaerolineae bacterium]